MQHDTSSRPLFVAFQLAIMMFLQFFLWGAWYVTLGPYMAGNSMSGGIADAYTVGPIAAILSPFFLGIIADRFFASQRVMGILHLIGGAALLAVPTLVGRLVLVERINPDGTTSMVRDHWPLIGLLMVHMLCYMPTLGLSNTIALGQMQHAEKQFPLIRVLGTVGWIVAGYIIFFAAMQTVPDIAATDTSEAAVSAAAAATSAARAASPVFFYIAGASGVLLGLYSFLLPHTPPPSKNKPFSIAAIVGADSLSLLKRPSFFIFILCSFLLCIPLSAYYAFAGTFVGASGFSNVPVTMSYGQMSEIFFMLVMPICFAALGVKWMLAVGMLAWVARYALFAGAPSAGVEAAGIMILIGVILHGVCYDFFFVTGQFYVDKQADPAVRAQAQGFLVLVTQGLGMLIGAQVMGVIFARATTPAVIAAGGTVTTPERVDWSQVWIVPCLMAVVVLVLFIAAFRGEKMTASNAE
jgi:nucleoside transporter